MEQKTAFSRSTLALWFAILAPIIPLAAEYSIIDLGPGTAWDVNAAGHVAATINGQAAWFNGESNRVYTPLVDPNGGPDLIPDSATAINDANQILLHTHSIYSETVVRARESDYEVIWTQLDYSPLGTALNLNGVACGYQQYNLSPAATLTGFVSDWSGLSQYSPLYAINSSGIVAGAASTNSFSTGNYNTWQPARACVFSNQTAAPFFIDPRSVPAVVRDDLNDLSVAYSINDHGWAAGYLRPDGSEHRMAFRYRGHELENLGTLGGAESVARRLNNRGQIVGWANTADGKQHAFLYDGETLSDLNDRLPANSGWELTQANAINEAGQIAGCGTFFGAQHAFLLTPPGLPPAPRITASPVGGLVLIGSTFTLQVEATGDALLYQWQKDGVDLIGATNQSCVLTQATTADAGVYRVIIFQTSGQRTISAQATVTAVIELPSANLLNADFKYHTPAEKIKTGPAATGSSTNDYWNAILGSGRSDYTMTNLLWADQTPSGASLRILNASGVWGDLTGDRMFDDYCYPANGVNIIVELRNLPEGTYDLYLYGHGAANNQNSVFEVNGQTQSTLVGAYWNNNQLADQNWIEGAHYVRFSGVQNLTNALLTITVHPGAGNLAVLNGLQLELLSDGLPAAWRNRYFNTSIINDTTGATADPDGDGAGNYQEYLAGTDPTNPESVAPITPLIQCLPARELFTNDIAVVLSTSITHGDIHYTLNGATPTFFSPVYTNALVIDKATTLQARVFINSWPLSEILTQAFTRWYTVDDGIPDAWREQYFGANYHTDPRVAADADPDGDGSINLAEYLAGTNPMDASSALKILDLHMVPVLTWTSISNRTYSIVRKDDLNSTNWVEIESAFLAQGSLSTYTDYSATNRRHFYWIKPLGTPDPASLIIPHQPASQARP